MNQYDVYPNGASKTTIKADRYRISNGHIRLFRGEDDIVAEFPSDGFGIAANRSVVA